MRPATPSTEIWASTLRVGRSSVTIAITTALVAGAVQAARADHPHGVPLGAVDVTGTSSTGDPHLRLAAGATLAPAKIRDIASTNRDIKAVVADQSGAERREDTSRDVTFAVQAEVLFSKDSATLSVEARSRIAKVAEEIRKQSATHVRVVGFTDNLGSSVHGDVLSKQRADALQGVLAKQLGDPGVNFEVRGYGEQFPIADNSTEAGRRKNRRVEVTFPKARP